MRKPCFGPYTVAYFIVLFTMHMVTDCKHVLLSCDVTVPQLAIFSNISLDTDYLVREGARA